MDESGWTGRRRICTDDVSFADASNGLIVGSQGDIIKTTDGGTTWSQQTSGTTEYLRSVDYIDVNTATAVGGNSTILRTTNGGTTWISQSNPSVRRRSIWRRFHRSE